MRSSRSATDPLDPGPGGFCHRGLHGPGVPENSLASFRAAIDLGLGIECDLQLSGCGTAMVFHDRDGRRLCARPDVVANSSAEEMAGWSLLGTEETVPTLAAMLDLVAGRVPLLLEMKEEGRNGERIAAATLAAMRDYDGPVGLMSFSARAMAFIRKVAPEVRRGLVLSGRDVPLRRWDKIRRSRPQFTAVKVSVAHQPWAQKMREDAPLYGWTARTGAEARRLARHVDATIWEGDGRPGP
ncbi:glycerophosphodiester phosphodiesterase family protein [Sphingomicrobium lutaoense]|uniref:Glycerophosphoryl diester phosphodiesterase n=1 Tax=Sphingomicrobium lutaoense TaxID=515949 RepID=A0A839Z5D3_9SPHN|nr:glycerophosphodiester phosphodiesterase family protein [Sphingomicrobium lutaoense]MBB3764875.1 glycerophosphoryl diester phosphodiesterase [Sphingomicrobium lutaoense]